MKQLDDYTLLENNPFTIKDEGSINRTAANIEMLPKLLTLRPIIVDKNGVIRAGNKRFQALKQLGYKEVPDGWIQSATNYTEEELKQVVLLDNVSEGVWDYEILAEEYGEIEIEEMGIEKIVEMGYSGKNQEINTDEFSDKMVLKFELEQDEYKYITQELSRINANKELALLESLGYEPT